MAYPHENGRIVDHDCDPLFPARWSPRAITGPVSKEEILIMIEAARWAPSSRNLQPWRFDYALPGSEAWDMISATLTEGNAWAKNAGALIVMSGENAFDSGAAWMSLALQSHLIGLATHAMGGFDKEAIRTILQLPEGTDPYIIIAIGRTGDPGTLPEHHRAREHASERKSIYAYTYER